MTATTWPITAIRNPRGGVAGMGVLIDGWRVSVGVRVVVIKMHSELCLGGCKGGLPPLLA